tara:strand:- start:72 stop:296 length:225 start_codon:yes stop_codon:yes gene_type:complete
MSKSRESFVRLAEKRTTRILDGLDSLANLSNRSNYAFSEEDVKKIFDAISLKLKSAEKRFSVALQSSKKNKFEL